MTKEQKSFEYSELKVLCLTVVAECLQYAFARRFKNEVQAARWVEEKVDEIIHKKWNKK